MSPPPPASHGPRSAIVTGGAGGLGEPTVRRLHRGGLHTVVLDRDGEAALALAEDLGEGAAAIGGSVLDDGDVRAAIALAEAGGELAVLVNLAGGGAAGGPTVRADGTLHPSRRFARTVELNAVGTWNCTRLAAAAMSSNAPDADGCRGVVVNTGSLAGIEGQRGQVAYAAAKAAVLGMTLPLARDLAPLGIRVCAIAPATMSTDAVLGMLDHLEEDPTKGLVFPARLGRPEEFAQLVEAIVANPYLNGENIRLDGAVRLAGS